MKLRTLIRLLASRQLGLLLRLSRAVSPIYHTSFLSAAASAGVLRQLAHGPLTAPELAARLGWPEHTHAGLIAWLDVGASVGVLCKANDRYALRSKLAKALARDDQDPPIAMLEQVMSLHRRLIVETPERLVRGEPFTLADQNGPLIARASRLAEPFVNEAIDAVVPPRGDFQVLDVGCGTGRALRYVCQLNPQARGVGLELQADVAELSRRNVQEWRLADRVQIDLGDVRQRPPRGEFDLVMLHSLIYYFPIDARVELLARLRAFLKPGGNLLVTSSCQGSDATLAVLNLWSTMTIDCDRLPSRAELEAQLRAAGFAQVEAKNLIPGVNLIAFTASG